VKLIVGPRGGGEVEVGGLLRVRVTPAAVRADLARPQLVPRLRRVHPHAAAVERLERPRHVRGDAAEEEHVRTFTRVSMYSWLRALRNREEEPAVREGGRMRWLETVLAPLDELPPGRKRLLEAALALTLGGEAIITMKDVCRLDNDETLAVLRWAATALLRSALQDVPGSRLDEPDKPKKRNGRIPR